MLPPPRYPPTTIPCTVFDIPLASDFPADKLPYDVHVPPVSIVKTSISLLSDPPGTYPSVPFERH